jgi:hypothetical protein
VARGLFQLLPHPLAELHAANHIERSIHLLGEYVKESGANPLSMAEELEPDFANLRTPPDIVERDGERCARRGGL